MTSLFLIFPSFLLGCFVGFFSLAIFNNRKPYKATKREEYPVYQHYKGKMYEVITSDALDEVTLEKYVVYRNLYNKDRVWVKKSEKFYTKVLDHNLNEKDKYTLIK